MSELHEALLRGLAPGGVMWLKAAGNSLWPLLRDGDSLKVERVSSELQLHEGEVAIVKLPSGILAAHLVAGLKPLRTASSVGVLDPLPLEALGRVIGFRRDGVERDWPALSRLVLRFLPMTARALKRLPLTHRLVRRARGW